MTVGDILKTKGATVETIAREATVAEAVQRLRDRQIGALVISPDGKAVEGSSLNAMSFAGSPTTAGASRTSWSQTC